MITQSFDRSINLELMLAALPPEDWDLTPALAAVEEELQTPVGPIIIIKRTAVLFDFATQQVDLDIETDAANCLVSGSTLTLVVSLLRSSVIEGVMQSASFSTHGGYVGGPARLPSHIDLLDDTESALLKLIQILGEEMLAKNGGQLCL